MKKTFILLAFALTIFTAQAQSFQKGTTAFNAGIGIGTALGGYGTVRPAISLSADHGIWETGGPGVISLGGYVGNMGYKYSGSGYDSKWNYFIIGARGAYHYNGFHTKNFDLYGGAMLGYNIVKYSSNVSEDYFGKAYGSGLGFSGFVGGRYFFSNSIGAFAELGYGISVLNAGLTFKF